MPAPSLYVHVALYIRLSVEDNKKRGCSVENQKLVLNDFLSDKPDFVVYDTYIDNGATGTNFHRPGFQQMLSDIEAGHINCVIVKDLSRLGRNSIDTGYYIEQYFHAHNVRFIAVTDQFDTADSGNLHGGIMLPLKNMINEAYALDIGRKIKAQARQAIEVTADYQGQTVTQVYSLKGKVTRYVQENISRPGEALRTGDTAGIWIIGRPTNIHKILRIYNPATTTVFYTDMPLQSVVNTDNGHDIYRIGETGAEKQVSRQPRIAAYLTESGTITLTKGSSDSRGYGSKPGSEGDQGNTGGIADSTRYGFGMLADITLQVEENPNFKLEPKYETVAENGGQVKAGDKLTISIPTLPIEQLAQDYKLQYCLLNYSTNIPGAEYIFSKWSKGGDSWEGEGTTPVGPEVALKSITFTVPKTTPAGTYRIYGGYLDVTHRSGGYEWLDVYANFYKMEISDLTITVLKGDIENAVDLIDAIGDVTLDSAAAIDAAKSAYDALSDEDKELVGADRAETLENAVAKLNQLRHESQMAQLDTIYKTTGDYISGLGTPGVGSIGGEWMTIGLARSGRDVPSDYYDAVVDYVKANIDENGRLDYARSTENSRIILALTAIGRDVTDVGGYNLLGGLDNMEFIENQGINGPIWALIALDSHDYPTSGDVTREKLVQTILGAALENGGWALTGTTADPDMTAMAMQALAPYYDTDENVRAAVDKALDVLSAAQLPTGGFASWGSENSESCAQVIVALTALGIDPATDSRFVKNGMTALDALASFYVDGGGFRHTASGELDGMATEQGYYALAAYYRFVNGQTSLYDMSDVTIQPNTPAMPDQPANPDTPDTPADSGTAQPTGDRGVTVWVIALTVSALCAAAVIGRKKHETE